jgi:hypothetical protein
MHKMKWTVVTQIILYLLFPSPLVRDPPEGDTNEIRRRYEQDPSRVTR